MQVFAPKMYWIISHWVHSFQNYHDSDDDDDDDDDDELLLYGSPTKGVYFQLGPLSEILTTSNLTHTARRI